MNEAWKKVYFYVCFHMKRGMENPDLDFDSYCNGTKWWNGQTHTGKRNTSISIIQNVQLFLIMVCCFGFSPFHVYQYSCTGTWSFNSIYERHDRDANSRSSLAVSDRSRGNSELQYFTDRHTSPALICASWGIILKGDRPWTLYSIFQHIYSCSNFNLNPIIIPWSPCLLIRASRTDLRNVQEKYTNLIAQGHCWLWMYEDEFLSTFSWQCSKRLLRLLLLNYKG